MFLIYINFLLKIFLRIFWIIIFISSFFFLPFTWAIFTILFVSVISPIISMIFYYFIKQSVLDNKNIRDFISGGIESIVFLLSYYFINTKFNSPKYFLLFLILEYSINQLNRIYRKPQKSADVEELKELIGFYIILISSIIISIIF